VCVLVGNWKTPISLESFNPIKEDTHTVFEVVSYLGKLVIGFCSSDGVQQTFDNISGYHCLFREDWVHSALCNFLSRKSKSYLLVIGAYLLASR
jgi:hypothetical protein